MPPEPPDRLRAGRRSERPDSAPVTSLWCYHDSSTNSLVLFRSHSHTVLGPGRCLVAYAIAVGRQSAKRPVPRIRIDVDPSPSFATAAPTYVWRCPNTGATVRKSVGRFLDFAILTTKKSGNRPFRCSKKRTLPPFWSDAVQEWGEVWSKKEAGIFFRSPL